MVLTTAEEAAFVHKNGFVSFVRFARSHDGNWLDGRLITFGILTLRRI